MGCVPHLGSARETLAICSGAGGVSMSTKREITKKYARGYGSESKKARGRMLDELAATTGIWLH